MIEPGRRKLICFFVSMLVYFTLMLAVIIFLRPQNFSLEGYAVALASGIMAVSYGFYASNSFVHARGRNENKEI